LRLFSSGGYGLALAALVFGAYDSYSNKPQKMPHRIAWFTVNAVSPCGMFPRFRLKISQKSVVPCLDIELDTPLNFETSKKISLMFTL